MSAPAVDGSVGLSANVETMTPSRILITSAKTSRYSPPVNVLPSKRTSSRPASGSIVGAPALLP